MAAVASGSSETGRPFPVLVVSRIMAPVLVADHERQIRSSPSEPSLGCLTSAHFRPRTSPGLRPVRHHTIHKASSLSSTAAAKKRSKPSRSSVVRSLFSIFGASASRATLWEIRPFLAARPKATLAVEWTWPTVEGAGHFKHGNPSHSMTRTRKICFRDRQAYDDWAHDNRAYSQKVRPCPDCG